MMLFLNATFTLGLSGGVNAFNQFKVYDETKNQWKNSKIPEKAMKPISGMIGLDLGHFASFWKFGLHSVVSTGYTLGPIAKSDERITKETWFAQIAFKPTFQMIKMLSAYGIVGIKITGFDIQENGRSKVTNMRATLSIPIGLGICVKPIYKIFLTLEGIYNLRLTKRIKKNGVIDDFKVGAPFSVKLGVAYAF